MKYFFSFCAEIKIVDLHIKYYIISFMISDWEIRERLRKTYSSMKGRCYNKSAKSYPVYGGKGIVVCDEWLNDFNEFFSWSLKNGWGLGLSIDRIDPNKGYSPENCQWITRSENSRRVKLCNPLNTGRPVGSGKYGEPTTPVRIPTSLLADFKAWLKEKVGK